MKRKKNAKRNQFHFLLLLLLFHPNLITINNVGILQTTRKTTITLIISLVKKIHMNQTENILTTLFFSLLYFYAFENKQFSLWQNGILLFFFLLERQYKNSTELETHTIIYGAIYLKFYDRRTLFCDCRFSMDV